MVKRGIPEPVAMGSFSGIVLSDSLSLGSAEPF